MTALAAKVSASTRPARTFPSATDNAQPIPFLSAEAVNRTVQRFVASKKEEDGHHYTFVKTSSFSIPEDSYSTSDDVLIPLPNIFFQNRLIGERSVNTLQEWECVIKKIEDNIVSCVSRSLVGAQDESSYMDVPLSEFGVDDRKSIAPGVVFRLIIGFSKKPSGVQTREAIIYIRDILPSSTESFDGLLDLLS